MIKSSKKYHRKIYLSVPHMGGAEMEYVKEAFESNWLSTIGSNLCELEKQFSALIGRPSLALSSGTAGMHVGLKLLGLMPEDEVIVPTLTFVAGCNPVLYEQAKPVFIDSDRLTWNLDPQRLEDFIKYRASINKLPKIVTVAHIFGQPADLNAIVNICNCYEIPLLEDAAESLGARYENRHPGAFGEIGIFSFNGNKIITSTCGGMLVAQDEELIDRARKWSTQSRDIDPLGINNYVHSEIGFNYRMSNVLAGIARGQLEVLQKRVLERRTIFERYKEAFESLPGIVPQPEIIKGSHTRWLSCFLINKAKFGMSAQDLIHYLESSNVETRPVWRPMHTQPIFSKFQRIGGEVAEDLNNNGICLPSSSSLSFEEQSFVIEQITEASKVFN